MPSRLESTDLLRPSRHPRHPLPVGSAPVTPFLATSLSVTPKREGDSWSHATEAWKLPPPRARQQDDADADRPEEGSHSRDHPASGGRGGGAYVGLFRPPGRSGKTSEMGFHVCVAIIPLDEGEGSGAVAEEFMDTKSPSQERRSGGAQAQEVRVLFSSPSPAPPSLPTDYRRADACACCLFGT